MRPVIYAMNTSLDGYIVGPDGTFDWSVPDPEVFRFWLEDIRSLGAHLLGRRLQDAMRYWETVDVASLDPDEREFARLWQALPRIVFSRTLTSVEGSARLATGTLAEEIEALRAQPGDGPIAVGGAALAAEAAALDLIDEYHVMVYPVLVGAGGTPYFALRDRLVGLELVESRIFGSGVVYLRYRVARPG